MNETKRNSSEFQTVLQNIREFLIRLIRKRSVALPHDILNFMLIILILALFAYGAYALWDSFLMVKSADPRQYEEYDPEKDFSIFEDMKKKNPDVFGWIKIYGTRINYPLAQGKTETEYLSKNAFGEYSVSGNPYLSTKNKRDLTDFNNIIYGHHMDHGAMFSDIAEFDNRQFFNDHKYGKIIYGNKTKGLEFCYFINADAHDERIFAGPAGSDEVKRQMMGFWRELAKYKRESGVSINERYVILVTCAGNTALSNQRHILIGRITDKVPDDTFGYDAPTDIQIIRDLIPWWAWFIALLVVIFLILIMRRRIKKKVEESALRGISDEPEQAAYAALDDK